MLTKDRAVCIRAVDYSETSQIVTFFARAAGKLGAIAKGSKRPKSAFDGPIEVLSFGDIVFAESRGDTLATLTEFQPRVVGGRLRRDFFALQCGLFAAELLDQLTHDYDPHPVLFDRFTEFLEDIEAEDTPGQRRDILVRLILCQMVLLRETGLWPVVSHCTNCRRPFGADWRASYFSSAANGVICPDCEMSFPDKLNLGLEAVGCLADLRQIAQSSEKTLDDIERVLIHHFTETLGRRLKMARHILSP